MAAVIPLLRSARSVSFSQFGEDQLLSVSLFPKARGRYIDVGAYHPWRNSNTYKLYLRGWSGVTVEPNPATQPLFQRFRPRDTHLVEGVAEREEALTYYEFAEAKLNTFSAEQAHAAGLAGSPVQRERSIRCRPLQAMLDEHASGQAFDLLSVDCEGYDLVVLKTIDFARCRPTAILIEDFEGFQALQAGGRSSPVQTLLRDQGYVPVGQAMYTALYLEGEALRTARSDAFHLEAVAFNPAGAPADPLPGPAEGRTSELAAAS
jgi:FkbM family methyltransferase